MTSGYQLWLVQQILDGRYLEIAKETIKELKRQDISDRTWYSYYLNTEEGEKKLAEALKEVANRIGVSSVAEAMYKRDKEGESDG